MNSEEGRGVRLRFIKVTRCHLIPDRGLIGYNAKGRDIYTMFGVYTPWCYNIREKGNIGVYIIELGVNMNERSG